MAQGDTLRHWQANGLLLIVTIVWGLSFVILKDGTEAVAPVTFNAIRFWIAVASVFPFAWRPLRDMPRRFWLAGAAAGFALFAGMALQILGLQLVSPATSAFITGLSVVLVPIGAALILRQPPGIGAVCGVIAATAGLALLSLKGSFVPGPGELLTLACAASFAAHILLIGRFTRDVHPLAFLTVQLLVTALLSTIGGLLFEEPSGFLPAAVPVAARWALLAMGLSASFTYLLQIAAQRYTTPTETALIFLMEPVFAALFAFIFHGERLGSRGLAGAGLILLGMMLAELWPAQARERT